MKKQRKLKQVRKSLRKTKTKLFRKTKHKTKHAHKKKKRQSKKYKKRTKMVMKGGAIPFDEFSPSNLLDSLTHGFKGTSSGGYHSDHPQHVPNNLQSGGVSSNVTNQPHLDGTLHTRETIAGGSPDIYFAPPTS